MHAVSNEPPPNKQQQYAYRLRLIAYFKRDGKGWQTRINQALVEYIETR